MTGRTAVVFLFVVGILCCWTHLPAGRAQDQGAPPAERHGTKQQAGPNVLERKHRFQTEPDFHLWKRKAQLELEVLQAEVEAKKAEIKFREAEYRANMARPDLAILTKLEMPVRMPFARETPLEDVLKHVKKVTQGPGDNGIPIYVDPVGLQEAGKTMESPVTIDLEGMPLSTTLRPALKQLGLTYKVESGLLTITSKLED